MAKNPDLPDYRHVLGRSCITLGQLRRDAGNPDVACDSYKKAIAMLKVLAAENPSVPDYRSDWAGGCTELGGLQRDAGKMAEAFRSFKTATDLLQQLVNEDTTQLGHKHRLARAYLEQGDLQQVTEKADAATASYERAVGLWLAIPEPARSTEQWSGLGEAFYRLSRWEESRQALEKVIAMRGDDAPTLAGGPRWWFLTMTLAQLGEHDQARSFYQQLVKASGSSTSKKCDLLRAEAAELLDLADTNSTKRKPENRTDIDDFRMSGICWTNNAAGEARARTKSLTGPGTPTVLVVRVLAGNRRILAHSHQYSPIIGARPCHCTMNLIHVNFSGRLAIALPNGSRDIEPSCSNSWRIAGCWRLCRRS